MLNKDDSGQILEQSLTDNYFSKRQQNETQKWKGNDKKAQKNGSHSAIYWVKKQKKNEDGSQKDQKWIKNTKYIGEWSENRKSGFGIQHYGSGNKYEGDWLNNCRNGQGTQWVQEGSHKLRREYTGDWQNDKKMGRGTMFYKSGDRYDGLWLDDKTHGEGRMIFSNGDVYEGMWFMGKRSGYGILTKRKGDHFEGHWVNDKREGQGSYFFSEKNQVFVGEWVDDMPKTGVYSEVEDPYTVKPEREKHFTDPYILDSIPQIKLLEPTKVLQQSMEDVRKDRTMYRAKYIPLDELYTKDELSELIKEFSTAASENNFITDVNLQAILFNMNFMSFELSDEDIDYYMKMVKEDYNKQEIEFDQFARLIAIILEEASNNNRGDEQEQEQQYQREDEELQ